jgi:superfamily II DNA or RNA helicase
MGWIVDNQEFEDGLTHLSMVDIFDKYIKRSDNFRFHVGTGFFFLNGFGELCDKINIDELKLCSDDYNRLWGTKAPILIMMGKETNQTTKEALIDAENMVKYALNSYESDYLEFLENLIKKDLIKFKVFTDRNFHAKIYFFYNGNDIMDVFVGSANLTSAGLSRNIELTAPVLMDYEMRMSHKQWFHNLWNMASSDLNVLEVIKTYKNSDFIFYEPKKFFENLIKIMEKDYLFYNSDISEDTLLVKFQSFDFYQVMSTLNKYNGCILASSVGLGKSYVALEVMRHFEKNSNKEALLIGPSGLVKGGVWNEYLKLYDLEVETIGYGDLQQKNFAYDKYVDYDLVVIDEAHNLRNPSNRRKNMMKLIKNSPNAKYLLLTATPINIKISDLNSLIDLFYDINGQKWMDKELKNIYEIFKTKVNQLEKTSDDDPKELLKEVLDLQNDIEKELIVKSTRSMIKQYFSEDLIKLAGTNELPEPEVRKEAYNYPKEYHYKFFDILPDFLYDLNYEHSKFRMDEKKGPIYSEDRNLIHMYKWLLYKRAESSLYSFYKSLKRLKEKLEIYKSYFENKMLTSDLSKIANKDLIERLLLSKQIYDAFKDDNCRKTVINNINQDIRSISKMLLELDHLKDVAHFKDDTKLERLKKIMRNNSDKKCLIFTEFFDTLYYLLENTKDEFSVNYVAGRNLRNQVMKPSQKDKTIQKFKDGDFQHLISTEVLSEGFNIPEADIVINYDLPYNPVRMIQRIGRATRINVPKKIQIRNFNPDEDIDQELKLIEKLQLRISNIISIIGIDYNIWSDTEEMVKEREKIDSVNKIEIIKELKRRIAEEDPEKIYKVQLRDESKLDILIRKSIEHYNIKHDDVPINKPLKPIYTSLVGKEDKFYGIYEFKDDYYEYGVPLEFIQDPPRIIKGYNNNEILQFCDVIRKKISELKYIEEDSSIFSSKDKELINKLKKIKKKVPPLVDTINRILTAKLHTNHLVVDLVKNDIYPSINNDGFTFFKERNKVKFWKEELDIILERENVEERIFLEEWAQNPEEYKDSIKAFIIYRGDEDV